MNRVMIIGSGGAGKSTLAKQLGEKLNLPVHHLDTFFWNPGWVSATEEELMEAQNKFVYDDKWIFDGNYSATMDIRMQRADTVIFLDLSKYLCTFRVIKRRFQYHNKTRPDMGEGCEEKIDLEFIKWVYNYPRDKKPKTLERLAKLPAETKVFILKSPKEVKQFLESIEASAPSLESNS